MLDVVQSQDRDVLLSDLVPLLLFLVLYLWQFIDVSIFEAENVQALSDVVLRCDNQADFGSKSVPVDVLGLTPDRLEHLALVID